MDGGRSAAYLARNDSGEVVYVTESAVWWNAPVRICEYAADDDALDQCKKITDRYHMALWEYLPDSGLQALDAPLTSWSLVFDDSASGGSTVEYVSFDMNRIFPPKSEDGIRELRECMAQWARPERLIDSRRENGDGQVLGRIPPSAGEEAETAFDRLVQSSQGFTQALMNEGRHFTWVGTEAIGDMHCHVFCLDGDTKTYYAVGDGWTDVWYREGNGDWSREEN